MAEQATGLPEFTYQQWCANSKSLLEECARYNVWRNRARIRLLADIAPRIGKLSTQMYAGAGFHYWFEQELGRLIGELASPMQWSASHCQKIPGHRFNMMIRQISVEELINRVHKAELSMQEKGGRS